jgi:O-antigen ligase
MTNAAAVLASLGVLGAVLGRSRWLVAAGLAALAAGELLFARELVPGGVGDTLASSAGALGLAVGIPLLAVLAWAFVRWPAAAIPAIVGTAPFRLPFEVGSDNRFFVGLGEDGALGRLVPLYVVVAAAGIALVWRLARGHVPRPLPAVLGVPTALFAAFLVLSYVWAEDAAAAQDRLVFFIVPFVAVLAIVARAPFPEWLPRVLAVEAVALASLFAVVGLVESATRTLLFYDPKVAVANEYTSYFRVTSLFSDPSIYARHVAVALTIVVVLLWRDRIGVLAGLGISALLFAGIVVSYSQSTMIALSAAIVVVTFLVADHRTRRLLVAAAGVIVVAGALAFAGLVAAGADVDRVTSGRTALVRETWDAFQEHPVAGVGIASQPAASRDITGGPRAERRHVSHTAPLTVAAELGIVGLALYVALLVGAVLTFRRVRVLDPALGLSLLGAFVVLFVHSLFYGVFLDDPLVWTVLGIAAAAAVPNGEPVTAPTRGRISSPRTPAPAPS